MAIIRKGADTPITLTNLSEAIEIKRVDFSQDGKIVVTKTGEDFTIVGTTGYTELSQEETLKFDENFLVDIQLAFTISGKARRTNIVNAYAVKSLYPKEI